jgi:branched-chain amino acid transport system ATP-binding protein
MTAALTAEGLHTYYGKSHILHGVSLEVAEGQVTALLGRNGAGKTTTLASIMGLVKPRAGSIRFDGAEICGCEPFEACRTGVGFVAENCRLFGGLTVAENFETARRPARSGPNRWDTAEVLDFFPDVKRFLHRRASALSGGEQRMVAIARTLVGNPTLLLLDEPSEGLAPLVVQALLERLRRLKETGVTVLLAEQNLRFATELADRIYIIERGEIRYEGRPAELAAHPEVREKYIMV